MSIVISIVGLEPAMPQKRFVSGSIVNQNFCQNALEGGASNAPNSTEAIGAHAQAGAAHRLLVQVCPLSKC